MCASLFIIISKLDPTYLRKSRKLADHKNNSLYSSSLNSAPSILWVFANWYSDEPKQVSIHTYVCFYYRKFLPLFPYPSNWCACEVQSWCWPQWQGVLQSSRSIHSSTYENEQDNAKVVHLVSVYIHTYVHVYVCSYRHYIPQCTVRVPPPPMESSKLKIDGGPDTQYCIILSLHDSAPYTQAWIDVPCLHAYNFHSFFTVLMRLSQYSFSSHSLRRLQSIPKF